MTLIRKGLAVGIIFLFIASEVIPMTLGLNDRNKNNTIIAEKYGFDRYLYPEYYHYDDPSERTAYEHFTNNKNFDTSESKKIDSGNTQQPLGGPMDSAWPMFGHDAFHTGRSIYTTKNNTGQELWHLDSGGYSPVIADDGTIYVGSPLNAIFPNGTMKWKYSGVIIETAPVLDDNGTIYFGTVYCHPDRFYAVNPNGTSKWYVSFDRTEGSPVLASDGTIIAPECNAHKIVALFPTNGTRKWEFQTNHVIYSSPAIGFDGTIYCGCHDGNIYALYPNGTLRWSFHTNGWVHGSPSIGIDGTIYCGSDDGFLYALNPANGSMMWCLSIGASYASPTIGQDGCLYIGVWEKKFYAINPNGTIRWIFDTSPGKVWGSTAALSSDGTLYFGTCDLEWSGGVEVIALWVNGTVKWRRPMGTIFSSPAIGRDGTIYIGSQISTGGGSLNAFGSLDPNAPAAPIIQGPPQGRIKKVYSYNFSTTDPLGKNVWYFISWGDGSVEDWIGPYPSGETVAVSHSWGTKGTYVIEARAKNTDNLWGPYGELEVTMPKNKGLYITHPILNWLFERFPNAFPILRFLLDFN
jgi:outer membrane protein assembly factor BamB